MSWCDDDHDARNAHLGLEFGWQIVRQIRRGERAGHGFRSLEQMQRWFTTEEQQRLAGLDYHLVDLDIDRVLAEATSQVLFTRRRPLRFGVLVMPWPCMALAGGSIAAPPPPPQDRLL